MGAGLVPWNYNEWRNLFRDFLADHPNVNVVWMGGDRHSVAWDSGAHNLWGGFPCLIGSGGRNIQILLCRARPTTSFFTRIPMSLFWSKPS